MSYAGQLIEAGSEPCSEPMPCANHRAMPTQPDVDELLVLRLQNGDVSAFEELVAKYRQPLINFANRALEDPMEAQDVTQAVFLQAFRASGDFRFAARFSTWLYTIARNLCRNELRRRRRQRVAWVDSENVDQLDRAWWEEEHSDRGSAAEVIFQAELQQKIEAVLTELPENQRTALLLLQEGDVCYQEIATVIGGSLSATKTAIHRGRQTLKAKLKPYLNNGTWQ